MCRSTLTIGSFQFGEGLCPSGLQILYRRPRGAQLQRESTEALNPAHTRNIFTARWRKNNHNKNNWNRNSDISNSRRTNTLASPSVTFGVSFFAVFLGHSLCTKEKEFYCLQGRSEGLFRKMTLVFPCFAVYATYEQVSLSHAYVGRFPGNFLVLAKYPNEK